MDESKIILGLRSENESPGKCMILKDLESHVAPLGTPAIIKNKNWKSGMGEVVIPFPPKAGVSPRTRLVVNFKNIQPSEDSLYKNLLIEHLDDFNAKKIEEIKERLKEEKIIAFKFASMSAVINFLERSSLLKDQYKYSRLFSRCTDNGDPGRSTEYHEAYLTLFDIFSAMPVFNSKKVDGLCFNFDVVYARRTKMNEKISNRIGASVVLSNFKENIIIVDGMPVNGQNTYDNVTISHFLSAAKSARKFDNAHKGSKAKEEDIIKEEKKEKKSGKLGVAIKASSFPSKTASTASSLSDGYVSYSTSNTWYTANNS